MVQKHRGDKRVLWGLAALAVLIAAALAAVGGPDADPVASPSSPVPQTHDPVERACALDPALLARIWRGYYGRRSEDFTVVPRRPNYPGGLELPSHSGPWEYLQRVPLVLYGPRRIKPLGLVDRHASITDVYPTVGRLLRSDLQARAGAPLRGAIRSSPGVPKLVLTIVWDGVGRNVLARWPDSWPTLARLERRGASFLRATVGSSPSITPATHATLGTGAFPRSHGVTAIVYRNDEGRLQKSFAHKDPSDLELETFADEIDRAYANEPLVGMLAWKSWHLGMLGHGRASPGGDADQLALIGVDGELGSGSLYSIPSYLEGFNGVAAHAERLDRADGEADGEWRGRPILDRHDNPAWVTYQSDLLMDVLRKERYGKDAVPDLLFTNFKVADIVGHHSSMDSPEMRAVLEAQDAALARLIRYLDREVSDYVVVLTSDHGHVPSPARTGAWAVGVGQLSDDLDRHFEVPAGRSLSIGTTSTGLFLNYGVMREMGVSEADIARWLNRYTLAENWREEILPPAYAGRGDEEILAAAFGRAQRKDIMRCTFGAPRPPRDFEA